MPSPKENRFLHSMPAQPAVPAMRPPAPAAGIMPHAMPAMAPKHPPRWGRLQEYLSKASAPIAPPKEQLPE